MQWLNYHHLYYFYTIASEGSVTKATKKLKLAQSTLSAQLKQFEETIGYQVFERKNRTLVLTDVGRRIYDYAHEIFSLGEELRDSLSNFEHSLKTQIRVGVLASVPKVITRELTRYVLQTHKAKLTVTESHLDHLCEMLKDHHLDLVMANDKPPSTETTSGFHVRLIGEIPIIFVGSPEFAHLKHDFPQSITDKPFILPGIHSPLRREVQEHFKIKHLRPNIVTDADDIELQKFLALDHVGVTAVPMNSVQTELMNGQLIRFGTTPICHENLWLLSPHRLVQNPVAKDLLENFRVES